MGVRRGAGLGIVSLFFFGLSRGEHVPMSPLSVLDVHHNHDPKVESAVFTPATAARENRRLHNLI